MTKFLQEIDNEKKNWVIDSGSCKQIEQCLSSEILILFKYPLVPMIRWIILQAGQVSLVVYMMFL